MMHGRVILIVMTPITMLCLVLAGAELMTFLAGQIEFLPGLQRVCEDPVDSTTRSTPGHPKEVTRIALTETLTKRP